MKSKSLVVWVCSSVLLIAGAALAQQSTPAQTGSIPNLTNLREVNDDRMIQPWNISVDRAEDMDLHSPAGQKVAEVEEVLEDSSGRITALVVEVDVPGTNDKEVVIALDQVNLQGDRLTTNLTADQLRSMPEWTQ